MKFLLPLLLAPLAQDPAEEAWNIKATARPTSFSMNGASEHFLTVRLSIQDERLETALARKEPVLKAARAGGKPVRAFQSKLRAAFGMERDEVERIDSDWTFAELDLVEVDESVSQLDSLSGVVPMLMGGEERVLRLDKFDSKKPRKLSHRDLKQAGIELTAWVEPVQAVVLRAKEKKSIRSFGTDGSFVASYGTTNPQNTYLAIYPEDGKLPKGLVVEVELQGEGDSRETIRLEKLKASKKAKRLKDKRLEQEGLEITIGYEPRQILHVQATAKRLGLDSIELATEEGELESEHGMKLREGLGFTLDRTFVEIPKDAFLQVKLRIGAEWREIPFDLKEVPIRR